MRSLLSFYGILSEAFLFCSRIEDTMSEKKLVVAVVGATGAVGREMLKTLESRNFPATEVVPFASARSAGDESPTGIPSWSCAN